MAAHAYLKNEFTEDKKCHNLMRWLISFPFSSQLKGQDPRSTNVFFNWYYWSINVGTLVALGGIAYLQQSMWDNGFFIGYLVAVSCLLAGMFVFLFGKSPF